MTWQADPRPRIFSGRTWRRFAVGHSRMAVRRTRGHSRRELGASCVKQVEKLLDVSPAGYRYRRRVRGRRSGACRPPSSGWNCADRRVRSACATVAIFFRAGMWRAIKQCDPVISIGAAGVHSEAVNARVSMLSRPRRGMPRTSTRAALDPIPSGATNQPGKSLEPCGPAR
jgi:hypothetical protein